MSHRVNVILQDEVLAALARLRQRERSRFVNQGPAYRPGERRILQRSSSALHEPDLAELRARTVGELKRAFVMANTAIGLDGEHLVVRLGQGGSLREVMVCYDTRFDLMTCPERGAPNMQRIDIR